MTLDQGQAAERMELTLQARRILRDNDRGGYTVPTAGLYPHQWNWDSVFVALGFATFDQDRAWREIETLFETQWPDGMVPHIIFRSDDPNYFPGPEIWQANHGPLPSSGISQPPVAATIVRRLATDNRHRGQQLFHKIDAWHRWWHGARDPHQLGVIAISHPWESGRDNLPDWNAPGESIDTSQAEPYQRRDTVLVDPKMRPRKLDYDRYLALVRFGRERQWDPQRIAAENPFWVADVGVTAVLLRAERDLLAMAETFGCDSADIRRRITRLERGFEQLWNPAVGAYCSLDLLNDRPADAATAATFLAPYAGITAHHDQLIDLLGGWSSQVAYLVPSFEPRDGRFNHIRYWCGPVWAVVNYMIADGFEKTGDSTWAERIERDTRALIERSGFAESFSPLDGQGCGGSSFSWTAAMWLAWAGRQRERC